MMCYERCGGAVLEVCGSVSLEKLRKPPEISNLNVTRPMCELDTL